MFKFKRYCILMLHVLVCLIIVLSLPLLFWLIMLLLDAPNWAIIAACCMSGFFSIWFMIIYIDKIVTKRMLKWLNED